MKYPNTWGLENCPGDEGTFFLPSDKPTEDVECFGGDAVPLISLIVLDDEGSEDTLAKYEVSQEQETGFLLYHEWATSTPPKYLYKKYFVEAYEPWPGPEESLETVVFFEGKMVSIQYPHQDYELVMDLAISTIQFE
jgi:hypothetical protein